MKVALVHDYLNEFGGAERVLLVLSEIFLKAPIYTAFYKKNSEGYKRFKDKKVIASWAQKIPFFAGKLHSPLRFLAPKIWKSVGKKLVDYDVVISSSSWYVTKGFGSALHSQGKVRKGFSMNDIRHSTIGRSNKTMKGPVEFCYCHTPPRWLYGYKTSIEWQKYWPVRVYGMIVGHFMRQYDFKRAQKVDYFIANSKEVKKRIAKFYRRKAKVIYPPVELPVTRPGLVSRKDYYLVISRIVGGKGLELAIEAAKKMGFKLKIAGTGSGWGKQFNQLKRMARQQQDSLGGQAGVEFVGQVSDKELVKLYSEAKGFLAMAENEDFGITPVEAMSCGTPVIAYRGGGYLETVLEDKTGVFFRDHSVESLIQAIKRFEKKRFNREDCVKQAEKFSKKRFKKELKEYVLGKIRPAFAG